MKFRLFFEEATSGTPYIRDCEKAVLHHPASSNKNSQAKTAYHVFELAGFITADASF
ncbi:hypothetical protein [Enterococcus sp. HMSC076E04]|uniref:hypothetical protein n=1 Tax=Enterococcus sp. HMSC076E04 TaxID=1739465 RepID=UPI00159F613E|nr:hypothetical protein [Enterococcus sp. HMSC076E04]